MVGPENQRLRITVRKLDVHVIRDAIADSGFTMSEVAQAIVRVFADRLRQCKPEDRQCEVRQFLKALEDLAKT